MTLTDEKIRTMEPAMLISIINMKLRNEYSNLGELTRAFDLDRDLLDRTLDAAGYSYQSGVNQVRRI